MKPDPENAADTTTDAAVSEAEGRLAKLGVQVDTMQAVLVRLLQDVVKAEAQLDRSKNEQLVAVNERLVVAAISGQADAEVATLKLAKALPGAAIDPLTRLENRAAFKGRALDAELHAKEGGGRFALLFIDLDDFKRLNDTRGHAFGDGVLQQVAQRMQATVRQADIVSRHGGDEFLVLLPELTQVRDAQTVAEKLAVAVAAPMDIYGVVVQVSASIGIAIYPDDAEDFQTLVARADAAMYHAKRLRLGTHAFHAEAPSTHLPVASDSLQTPAAHASAADPSSEVDEGGSAQRTRQEHLRMANERLLLAALSSRDLQAAAELARARQAAFMTAVADELRDAQSPIRIASAMLGRASVDELLLPRVQGLVDEQMTHIASLLDRIGAVAETTPLAVHSKLVKMDLALAIEEAVAAELPHMHQRNQIFEWQQAKGPLPVSGDANCLVQVICNLLNNASKHNHDGGKITLSVNVEEDALKLAVQDNGIGIHPSMLGQVFDPFVQDIHALGFNGTGLGIGLTAARTLARAHGGELTAQSEGPHRGSLFVLTLPMVR
jgi:diguanylate cyclase (GGDEF)-like protein